MHIQMQSCTDSAAADVTAYQDDQDRQHQTRIRCVTVNHAGSHVVQEPVERRPRPLPQPLRPAAQVLLQLLQVLRAPGLLLHLPVLLLTA